MSNSTLPQRERLCKPLSQLKHTFRQLFCVTTPESVAHALLAPGRNHPTNASPETEHTTGTTPLTPVRGLAPFISNALNELSLPAVIEQISTIATQSARSVPVLGPVLDVLSQLLSTAPTGAQNRAEYQQVRSSILTSIDDLRTFMDTGSGQNVPELVNVVAQKLGEQINELGNRQRRSNLSNYPAGDVDIDDLIWRYRMVQDMLQRLQVQTSLATWKAINNSVEIANEERNETRMQRLQPALAAKYDSYESLQVHRTGCTQGTREQVLRQLESWARDPRGAKIYWMNGMAGTGKTTIAYTLCERLKAASQLAASFFCSRSLPECRDVSRIAPTVAYQLARCSPPYQEVLCQALGQDPDMRQSDLKTQWTKLVAEPLKQVKAQLPSGLLVVVIDALDECSDHRDASRVLSSLLDVSAGLPVKYFITCRPDIAALHRIEAGTIVSPELYHLHNVEDSLVQADIHMYLTEQLSAHATPDQIRHLAGRAGRLFIYAATAVRYVALDNPTVNHRRRLASLLVAAPNESGEIHVELDKLYETILYGTLATKVLNKQEKEEMKQLLDTVVCASEPLTASGLASLLSLESADQARYAIQPLRSVLFVDDRSELVTVLHASFADYILNPTRARSFVCHQEQHHQLLTERCFNIMFDLLHFNMAQLASSFVLDRDISDLPARRDKVIPAHLAYACRSWSTHAVLAESKKSAARWVYQLLRTRVIYWLEAMNLMNCILHAVRMLLDTHMWLTANCEAEEQTVLLCQDAYSFAALIGASPVQFSTPHIYVSVLALWDKRRPMWMHYGSHMQGHVKVQGLAVHNRESGGLTVWGAHSSVYSLDVSSDGRNIATGSFDGRVRLWDARNGTLVASAATAHNESIISVRFSPDATQVASSSHDGTIRVWDAMTGAAVGNPFSVNSDTVWSVDYTPDGSRMVSSHNDGAIRIWDTTSGMLVLGPLNGHTSAVNSVACALNGLRFVSGSDDMTVRVWDVETGEAVLGPLHGHTNKVWSVAYSPDSMILVSGSLDRSIRIWDSVAGKCIGFLPEAHAAAVLGVRFSPDSQRIVSVSSDQTVCIWDVAARQIVVGPFRGHTSRVYSAAFMLDGRRVVSGSEDGTVRVWDAYAALTPAGSPHGHTGGVMGVTFSPDSRFVASGSDDGTVCVWEARTGQLKVGPFRGHTDTVWSVTFSPDGNSVVSGSTDTTVHIWYVATGDQKKQVCSGHTGWVRSVSVCPDGSRVASGSCDHTVRVWDMHTGQPMSAPFTGHTDIINSVAYSPDGHRIVSGSGDQTVRVWDANTGDMLLGPLQGHTDVRKNPRR